MIPRASLVWLFAGVAGVALVVAVIGSPGTVWVAVLGAVIGFAGLDALLAARTTVPVIERKLPASMSLILSIASIRANPVPGLSTSFSCSS